MTLPHLLHPTTAPPSPSRDIDFGHRLFVLWELADALGSQRDLTSRDGLCAHNTRNGPPEGPPADVRGLRGRWRKEYRPEHLPYVVLWRNAHGDWPLAWVSPASQKTPEQWVFPELTDAPAPVHVHQSVISTLVRLPTR